jgi:hypothetical protein
MNSGKMALVLRILLARGASAMALLGLLAGATTSTTPDAMSAMQSSARAQWSFPVQK